MRPSITCVTSVTGGKDRLIETHKRGNAKFVAFTDREIGSTLWETRPAYNRFTDPRRNSRIHKLLIHQYIDSEYTIWIDGNIELLKTPDELVETYLKDHDIMMFTHQLRDCVYDEAMTTAKSGLDDPEVIIEQAKTYEDAGFAKHKGLYVGNFIIRRNTAKVQQFNDTWWSEYCRHSVRDQISLPYALDNAGLRIKSVTLPWFFTDDNKAAQRGDEIRIHPHIILNPPTV